MYLKKRVLFIDDDAEHLLLCNLILTRRNYDVLTLVGCEELGEIMDAVDIFKPDVIFLDHNMPGHCGLDVAKLLRSKPSYDHVPIVYFSGDDDIDRLAAEAGAASFLRKPFDQNSLVSMTERYTGMNSSM